MGNALYALGYLCASGCLCPLIVGDVCCVSVYLDICVSVSVYVSVCSHVSVCPGSASVCLCGSEYLGLSFRTHSHERLRKREMEEGRRE